MQIEPGIQYDLRLVALSVSVAVGACGLALWMAFRLKQRSRHAVWMRAGAAVLMGSAIAGMHYIGMAAASFPTGSRCTASALAKGSSWLSVAVVAGGFAVMAIARVSAVLDRIGKALALKLAASLADANESLTYVSLHDPLTQLSNRSLLEDKLRHTMRGVPNAEPALAVLFIDLDNFKSVNDAYGHQAGDALLVEMAQRIAALFTASDTVARFGGDEFVVAARFDSVGQAMLFADCILAAARRPFNVEGEPLRLSVSVGVALYPGDGESVHEVIRNADAAMYQAKAQGRDRQCFFDPSMTAHAKVHLAMVQELRTALERHDFVLFYQPQMSVTSERTVGVEALLRWRHPSRGWVAPSEFLPLAERFGLIVPLGSWVLNEACRQLAEWHRRGYGELTMSVNLSALQFADAGLADRVGEALANNQVGPGTLTLEVTESVAMENVEQSMRILQTLREMGVSIAIDDFGTGYSSLLYLQRFPATELKIDCGFVRQLTQSAEDVAIASAIVALGKTLHLKVVAEGVETEEQKRFLAVLGCDLLQGFLPGRPMPADQLWAHLCAESAACSAMEPPEETADLGGVAQ